MSRLDAPNRLTVKPGINVYTGLALLSCLVTLAAFVFATMQFYKIQ